VGRRASGSLAAQLSTGTRPAPIAIAAQTGAVDGRDRPARHGGVRSGGELGFKRGEQRLLVPGHFRPPKA
jgi:hypothetical protein